MSLRASLVAKVVTELDQEKFKIGTAYPIREDVVITAYHVIPDYNQLGKTFIEWSNAEGVMLLSSSIADVLYVDEKADIAIIVCKTPENTPIVDVCLYPPESTEGWDSIGYPEVGVDHELQVRKRIPASGTYYQLFDDDFEMHLHVKGDAADTKLWRGMSGAPVFTTGTNKLTAIITKVPNHENPDFENRIYSTSLAYLLNGEDTRFEKSIRVTDHCNEYIERQQKALLDELKQAKEVSNQWFEELAKLFAGSKITTPDKLSTTIYQSFRADPVNSIESLRLASESYMQTHRDTCELLLLRILAFSKHQDRWSGHHLHDFKVRTRLLCELRLASRYQIDPQLKRLTKGEVTGVHAIEDHSAREVGFDDASNAEEQAKTISHYIYHRWDDEYDLDEMTVEDWQGVCAELSTRRKGGNPALVRFEINAKREAEHPLASESVRRELYKLLPELPIVLFGTGVETDETLLRTQVKVFYEKLDNS